MDAGLPPPETDDAVAPPAPQDSTEPETGEADVNKENENKLLPKRVGKRTFATKSTGGGNKRRKLSAVPSKEAIPEEQAIPEHPIPEEQAIPIQMDDVEIPDFKPPQNAAAPEPFQHLPPETYGGDPDWLRQEKNKDPDFISQDQEMYEPAVNKAVDSFPTGGFPAPLPGGMGHPYSPVQMHQQPQLTTGQLAGGFGSSDAAPAQNNGEATQGYKWVECAFCLKWRKIPAEVNDSHIPQPWSCAENKWDQYHNTCNSQQEDDGEVDETPFTMEEMNAPLPMPAQENMAGGYNPYVYDQSGGGFENEGYPPMQHNNDDWEPQDGNYSWHDMDKKKRRSRPRPRPTNTVSLSNLLDNSEGVDPQYAKERKEFYTNLEQFLQRPPDVNLLCGAPVDLYQLYTETTGRGGYEQVCTSKQWREIFRQLPQYSQTHTSASYALKKMYRKNLLEYENAQRGGFQ